ncbi:MAG: hypothetical protein WCO52_06225, partial [bacterium]
TNDDFVVFDGAATTSFILPLATGSGNRKTIKNTGTGDLVVAVNKTDTIDGLTSRTIAPQESVDFCDSATGKWIVATTNSTGMVTSVSVVTANGISGTVANPTSNAAITLSLGAITPSSVNSVVLSGSSTPTLAVTGTASVSNANTGDQTLVGLGGVPTSRTISTTAPITGGGNLSADRTLAMAAAASGVNGYLTSTDWASFTAKAELPITTAVASATLTAGQWVSFHDVAGVKNVRPADSTDATKPVHGFVLSGFSSSATATVYLFGINNAISIGSFVAADAGKPVFLSTAGGTTLTPPATTGNLLQQVGYVDGVGATLTVNLINSPGIVRA